MNPVLISWSVCRGALARVSDGALQAGIGRIRTSGGLQNLRADDPRHEFSCVGAAFVCRSGAQKLAA